MRKSANSDSSSLGLVTGRFVGMSYAVLLVTWLSATVLFALIYLFLSYSVGNGPDLGVGTALSRFLNALYFSIITATSTGYGDIVPQGFSKLFAALQSMSSLVLLALFVAKFSSRRQEVALAHIHEFASDSAFHGVRQGLFIARKDLDVIIRKVEAGEGMEKKDWRDLKIAFRQIEIFVRRIGNFYEKGQELYIIDEDRERLLLDAVERTFGRVTKSLDVFDRAGVSYIHQEGCIRELKKLAFVAIQIFEPEKEKAAHTESKEVYAELFRKIEDVLRHVEKFAEAL